MPSYRRKPKGILKLSNSPCQNCFAFHLSKFSHKKENTERNAWDAPKEDFVCSSFWWMDRYSLGAGQFKSIESQIFETKQNTTPLNQTKPNKRDKQNSSWFSMFYVLFWKEKEPKVHPSIHPSVHPSFVILASVSSFQDLATKTPKANQANRRRRCLVAQNSLCESVCVGVLYQCSCPCFAATRDICVQKHLGVSWPPGYTGLFIPRGC